jgi:hypothetical protein
MIEWFLNPLGLLAFANILIILGSIFIGLKAFRK